MKSFQIYAVTEESILNRVALLINNIEFREGFFTTRRGAEKDEQAMQTLLIHLGYEVVNYKNLPAQVACQGKKQLLLALKELIQ